MIISDRITPEQFMWYLSKRFIIGSLGCGLVAAVTYQLWVADVEAVPLATAAEACQVSHSNESEIIDCWMTLIEDAFTVGGTQAAFDDFIYIYKNFDVFASTGCHKHAHRVGDLAYYYDYVTHQDLDKVGFPKNATTCGYGFYHGFIEHLVQNDPRAAYVDEVCPYFAANLSEVAPDIEQTCYHGAGHGFVIAQADRLLDPADWTIEQFTANPLQLCDQLTTASEKDQTECHLGVFTVMTEWMFDGEFGLSYPAEAPYAYCDSLENPSHQEGCYLETTQKFDFTSQYDMTRVKALLDTGTRPDLYELATEIALAGFMQRDPSTDGLVFFAECSSVFTDNVPVCIRSVIGGLLEHGPPVEQYKKIDAFCAQPTLTNESSATCFEAFARKLHRFTTSQDAAQLCTEAYLSAPVCEAYYALDE